MVAPDVAQPRFHHEALLYEGLDGFLAEAIPFVRAGIERDETVLVVLDTDKLAVMQGELGGDGERVNFADMAVMGRNPARLIPQWQRFLDEQATPGRPVRGLGEPIWAGRSAAELVECQAHERLLNLAFAGTIALSMLCPYDVSALPPDVLEEARLSHRVIVADGTRENSGSYVQDDPSPAGLDAPLAAAPDDAKAHAYGPAAESLREVRSRVENFARDAGLDMSGVDSVVMAASELATNSLRYGGGYGTMRMWSAHGTVVCEFSDAGRITGPALLGRQMPSARQDSGRGLWLANQLCDLVQIRSGPSGTTIRLHVAVPRD
jgi:anti-sigma regulatory factor (Ser/Thr protein kinase)